MKKSRTVFHKSGVDYCDHCFQNFGSQEDRVVESEKTYHNRCYQGLRKKGKVVKFPETMSVWPTSA